MGYRTTLSKHGGDSGIDITAYKDELPPRILVQVKSCYSDIKETTIQSLKGTMCEGDYGLFITLSDYTKNAKTYLDNKPIIRGINGTELVELILKEALIKSRLTAWHAICLHIFRHITQILLDLRQQACVGFRQWEQQSCS